MEIKVASDSSVLVVLGAQATEAVQQRVSLLTRKLLRLGDGRIRNIHAAYASVLIDFDPLRVTHAEVMAIVEAIAEREVGGERAGRVVEIPVWYGGEFGMDLDRVAEELGISADEVVSRHAGGTYFVSFFGFSPGFAYLSGLPSSLQVARLQTPRRLVKAGSVGIAGTQTGVYPVDSPGGWRIVGRTPLRMFDPEAERPSPLEIGDSVRFVAISRDEFDARDGERL